MTAVLQTTELRTDARVVAAYGALTDDANPIHLDPDFAAATPMGRCIAHGTMSICLLWRMIHRSLGADALRHADLDVRFVKPVFVGETIRAGGEPTADGSGSYAVWVRGEDGVDRLTGTVRLEPAGGQS